MTSTPTTPTATAATGPATAGPTDPLGADLIGLLRTLKLSGMQDTLPERLSLARTRQLSYANFLELLLSDEVSRRDARSATVRAAHAGLLPLMRLDTWNEHENLSYDRQLLSDLTSLRFVEAGHNVLILGPVGVGKTHLATALGHIAIRRRLTVQMARAEKLFTRLRAARLDNTLDAEFRRLTRLDLLVIDDFALRPLDATTTADFYELVVERHKKAATIWTSNREPADWLSMTTDPMLAQSAVDRLTGAAHTLIIEGPSHRQRTNPGQRVGVDPAGR
jgi:DNA replication protein DnaC